MLQFIFCHQSTEILEINIYINYLYVHVYIPVVSSRMQGKRVSSHVHSKIWLNKFRLLTDYMLSTSYTSVSRFH